MKLNAVFYIIKLEIFNMFFHFYAIIISADRRGRFGVPLQEGALGRADGMSVRFPKAILSFNLQYLKISEEESLLPCKEMGGGTS